MALEEDVFGDMGRNVQSKLSNQTTKFDIGTIMLIIGLAKTVLDLYLQCKGNDWHLFGSDAKAMRDGSWNPLIWLRKRRLQREIASVFKDPTDQVEVFNGLLAYAIDNQVKVAKMFELREKEIANTN